MEYIDFLNAILSGAERTAQEKKEPSQKDYDSAAKALFNMYVALCNVGFTKDQAWSLTKIWFSGNMSK
jgi:hypothetical protein